MINFTVGPVMSSEEVLCIGSGQVPYFRTENFSKIMFENEELIKKFAHAEKDAKTVFITGSGTASMEAVIINVFSKKDKLLIINGGSFGKRFVELCEIYNIPYTEIVLETGKALKQEMIDKYNGKNYTGFLVNMHETSTGVLYNINMISQFCRKNNIFLVVDAISSFLADEFDMSKLGVGVMITSSQKALACPPGVSIIVLSCEAVKRIENRNIKCMYFNLKNALINAKRGQTPFTPAVQILFQINRRLKEIDSTGGVIQEIWRVGNLAKDFRCKIQNLPFKIISESLSNAVTPLHPLTASAYDIFLELEKTYKIWICPNGGELKDKIFRVGHIGNLTVDDNNKLIWAFNDMKSRGLI